MANEGILYERQVRRHSLIYRLVFEDFMDKTTDPIERIRQWGRQTIAFACSIENAPKTGLPKEVLEQAIITAEQIANRLLSEASTASGGNLPVTMTEFISGVLDWVVEKRKKATED
jgi:hypothetical protein